MNTCEIVTKTIDVLRERGWCKNRLEDEEGRVCIRGAMNVVVTRDPNRFPNGAHEEVEQEMGEFLPVEYQYCDHRERRDRDAIVLFNNAEETTEEDIFSVLEKTKEKVC